MGDEIRVTVIATGFDSHVQNVVPQPRYAEPVMAVGGGGFAPLDNGAENIDVPTFIRRQAD